MLLYKLKTEAEKKEPEDIHTQHLGWGTITIAIVWLPGLVKTTKLASKMKWSQESVMENIEKAVSLFLLFVIWPVYSILL